MAMSREPWAIRIMFCRKIDMPMAEMRDQAVAAPQWTIGHPLYGPAIAAGDDDADQEGAPSSSTVLSMPIIMSPAITMKAT